ncbi:MAG: hypothetical protein R3B72_49035, partial [Polyangiaceae bacterium]
PLAIYALGGGSGHVVRGASLAAALAPRRVRLLVPWRLAGWATSLAPEAEVVGLSRPASPTALAEAVGHALTGTFGLVLDSFPEGLLDELEGVHVRGPRLGVLRLRRDAEAPRFRRGLAACDAVIDVEGRLDWLAAAAVRLPGIARPIADEPGDGRGEGVVLLPGGDPALQRLLDKLGTRLAARGVAVCKPRDGEAPWRGAPRVAVGAAGYNLSYELARAGVHHLAIPRPRPFDDQRRRAEALAEVARDPAALEEAVIARLTSASRPPAPVEGPEALAAWVTSQL